MIYVLMMVIAGGGGFSAEFDGQAACESALARMQDAAAQAGPSVGICVPKALD
jgi:hypothetical protein